MKILMLTPYLPFPLLSGGQIRSYNLLKKLSAKHQITLVALIKHDEEKRYIFHIEKFCHKVIVAHRPEKPWTITNIVKTGLGKYPFLVVRNYSDAARRSVIEELKHEHFDLIHAETFYVMPHIPQTTVPILLVEQTVEYLVYQHFVDSMRFFPLRLLFMIDVFKIRFWEEYYWRQAREVVAMSEADKRVMQKRLINLDVAIVPNGVDETFFAFQKKQIPVSPTVLFVGNFKWLQNREAVSILVRQIWPKIIQKLPKARLWIVGRFPTPEIKNLTNEQIMISDDIDDIREAYRKSDLLIAPIFGPGGTRYKILEAMASGVPVVTTPQGIEGLGVTDGKEALICRDMTSLANATVEVLTNQKLYKKLAQNSNVFVRTDYNWKRIAGLLDSLYEEVAHETKN